GGRLLELHSAPSVSEEDLDAAIASPARVVRAGGFVLAARGRRDPVAVHAGAHDRALHVVGATLTEHAVVLFVTARIRVPDEAHALARERTGRKASGELAQDGAIGLANVCRVVRKEGFRVRDP